MKKTILCILVFFFLFGCSIKNIDPIIIPTSNFEKTENFVIETHVEKPAKPNYILLDSNFQKTTNTKEIKYFAFTSEEFAKIIALSKSFDSQKDMINELEKLVNIKIEQINTLKEITVLKENLSQHLALLYSNEQNIRSLESRNFQVRQIMDRVFMIIQAGVIIALAIAL